jgi:integrase
VAVEARRGHAFTVALAAGMIACRAANERRHQVVHSIHFPQPDLSFPYQGTTVLTVKSTRRTPKDTITSWKLGEIRKVAGELGRAWTQLLAAAERALGHEDYATTQRYAHLAPDAHNKVLESWNRRLDASVTHEAKEGRSS